jgi:energy-coupling factor transport system permease protein
VLELQRNVIFGQFVETGSFIHRMDARVKIVAASVLIVASFLIDDFLGFAVIMPLLVIMGIVSKIPLGYVLRGSRFFLAFLVFILAFQVLFYPGDVPASDYLWHWGILSVSTGGLYAAGILALRVIFLYYVITMLMLTTSLVDLTNGLELIFGPLQRLRYRSTSWCSFS